MTENKILKIKDDFEKIIRESNIDLEPIERITILNEYRKISKNEREEVEKKFGLSANDLKKYFEENPDFFLCLDDHFYIADKRKIEVIHRKKEDEV
jgi:hypothetical protein